MATPEAIAIRKAQAQARIAAAAGSLADSLGFDNIDLAPTHKDPAIQVAVQLEAVADFLEAAVEKLIVPEEVEEPVEEEVPEPKAKGKK